MLKERAAGGFVLVQVRGRGGGDDSTKREIRWRCSQLRAGKQTARAESTVRLREDHKHSALIGGGGFGSAKYKERARVIGKPKQPRVVRRWRKGWRREGR